MFGGRSLIKMKFRDIPQFTKHPANGVFVSLNYLETKVNDDIRDYGLQLNPDFQRGHIWTEAQQIAFIEYVLRGGQSGRCLCRRASENHCFA